MIKELLQGRFMSHPLHPLLVHLPIGLWVVSLVFDVVYAATGNPFFASASFYVIGIGICGALLAAPAGMAEMIDIPRRTLPMRIATTHMVLNLLIVGLYALNFFMRGDLTTGPAGEVTITELVLNVVSIGLLSVSGYLGGMLVYEHGVGMQPEKRTKGDNTLRRVA